MRSSLFCAAAGALFAAVSSAAPEHFNIDPARTAASFEVRRLGVNWLHGRFDRVTGRINLDRRTNQGSIDAEVDVNSVNTGWPVRDRLLKSQEILNVAQFPKMTFHANKVRFKGDDPVGADGELTLLGVTKPTSVEVQLFKCAVDAAVKHDICGAVVRATIRKSDFGMTWAARTLADEVRISINLEALRIQVTF